MALKRKSRNLDPGREAIDGGRTNCGSDGTRDDNRSTRYQESGSLGVT
jgi:hypothetical protein